MNILGINGWANWFHDTSAALIVDGRLVAFCEEERFSRQKHASSPPREAVQWCLQSSALNWQNLDAVCLGWDLNYFGRLLCPPLSHQHFARQLLAELGGPEDFSLEKIHFFEHHLCHAHSILGLHPGQDGLVLIIDGQGEQQSTSIYRHHRGLLHKVLALDAARSLGYFYEAGSTAAGFGLTGTGKLMGLSAYGTARTDFFTVIAKDGFQLKFPWGDEASRSVNDDLDDAKKVVDHYWLPLFRREIQGLPGLTGHQPSTFAIREALDHDPAVKDFSAAVQNSLEKAVRSLLSHYLQNSDKRIFLAGGVALNCKNNGAVLAHFQIDMEVQPLSNDAGVALGAAFYYAQQHNTPIDAGDFPFVGPSFTDEEIIKAIRTKGLDYEYIAEPWHAGAQLIAENKIIGWFQGKAEVGPRALGARSILAKPDSTTLRDRINKTLKKRESWRPFGPSLLEEHAAAYFEHCSISRFMLIGFPAKARAKATFAGTIHVDGTSRVQTVPADSPNRHFRLLLESYYQMSGIPGILNTSFNRAGEPIVGSPAEALTAFGEMGLDALIIGHYLVKPTSLKQT